MISKTIAQLAHQQKVDVLAQLKIFAQHHPIHAHQLLLQNPQLASTLLHLQVSFGMVKPEDIAAVQQLRMSGAPATASASASVPPRVDPRAAPLSKASALPASAPMTGGRPVVPASGPSAAGPASGPGSAPVAINHAAVRHRGGRHSCVCSGRVVVLTMCGVKCMSWTPVRGSVRAVEPAQRAAGNHVAVAAYARRTDCRVGPRCRQTGGHVKGVDHGSCIALAKRVWCVGAVTCREDQRPV